MKDDVSCHTLLLRDLPDLDDILRGSLLQRIIRHRQGCPKCERGEGRPVSVLTVTSPEDGCDRSVCVRNRLLTYAGDWTTTSVAGRFWSRSANSTNLRSGLRPPRPSLGDASVIDIRRQRSSFGDGLIRETVDELWLESVADAKLVETGK